MLAIFRHKQKALSADCYQDLQDAVIDGDRDPSYYLRAPPDTQCRVTVVLTDN